MRVRLMFDGREVQLGCEALQSLVGNLLMRTIVSRSIP